MFPTFSWRIKIPLSESIKVAHISLVPQLRLRIIGYGATISAPHMHALACENLLSLLQLADKEAGAILDVGCGSGYCESTNILHLRRGADPRQ
jgi:hypothetical protein